MNVNESRRNNQIGKIKMFCTRRKLQAVPGSEPLDNPILDHNYRVLNYFGWSEELSGGDADLHRKFVIVKNRAGVGSGLYSLRPCSFELSAPPSMASMPI